MPEYDVYFTPQVVAFRKWIRERYIEQRSIPLSETKLCLNQVAALSYLLIMLNSQSLKHEICKTQYYSLINGKHECLSFISDLKEASICDLFQHYGVLLTLNSMQILKEYSLVNCLV